MNSYVWFINRFSMFQIKKIIKSLTHALNGLSYLFKNETNAVIHLSAALTAVLGGFMFKITQIEWAIVCLTIGLVLGLEALNTAIEELSDHTSPEISPAIKKVKDLSAGGVLIASTAAFVVGLIIFAPRVFLLFQ